MAIREPSSLHPDQHRPRIRGSLWGKVVVLTTAIVALSAVFVGGGLPLPDGSAGAAGAPPTRAAVGQAEPVPVGSKNLGPAGSSTPLSLDVVLSPRDPAALDAFLAQVYDPSSPQYHRFLTKGAFGPEFGASRATIALVSSTLRAEGLSPGVVAPNDLMIPVHTTASAAESAFNVQIDSYQLPSGRLAHANTTPPQVVSSIASDLVDVAGLSDVAQLQPGEGSPSAGVSAPAVPQAQLVPDSSGPTPCSAASAVGGSYTANQLAHAYGFDTGAYALGQLGAGETIALFELEPFSSSDVGTYQTCYGISTNDAMVNVTVKSVDGGAGSGSGSGEAALDVEDVTGLAPAASIDVYEAPNSDTGDLEEYAQIAEDDSAQVVSTSWGLCELEESPTFADSEETDFEQMAAQGQSVLAAAGDDGSEGCGSGPLAVVDPASDPYVTGVGGTTLSAIGPPPSEEVWNESSQSSGAGGGGISSFWRMPSWQTPIGVNPDSSAAPCGAPTGSYCREVPDVSASADPFDGYTVYYQNQWQTIGGTSGAAPLWGALVVLANEGCSASAGFLNPALYAHESDLNDITSGNDDYTGTNGGLYPATTGYDMASGLGTPTSALFAPGVLCTTPKLVVTTEPPSSVAAGSNFAVAVSVENSSGTVQAGDDTTLVSLAITSNTGTPDATLHCAGANSATVTSGVARFSCSVNDAGLGYTLTASAAALGSVVSSSFTVLTATPSFPTFGAYPSWLPANDQVSNVDHAEGSDTTLFVMEAIGNLYAQAGLFPFSCQLTSSPQNQQCLTPAENSGNNPNNTETDTSDNFAATEELQGINDVGSSNGQGELCGTSGAPVNTTVDYARSSKPFAVSGCDGQELGFAKDSVPVVDFRFNIDPEAYGTPTGYLNNVDPACGVAGQFPSYNNAGTLVCTAFPSGGIGPVAAGWLPGDPFNCTPKGSSGTNCSGTAFTDVDNTAEAGSGLGAASSTAYRLWCQHGASATAGESEITDWGQLTNLAPGAVPGEGTPIGVPIRIIGVNSGSGTAATFNNFAKSGVGSGNCTAPTNYNENAASQGDPENGQGPAPTNPEIALENDANQIGDFAGADWGATDPADQVVDIATSLYYMGNGPYNTNPNASLANLEVNSGVVPSGVPTSFEETQLTENGVSVTIPHERTNAYPTSRTLFNIYRQDKIRASTAGFLNWLCDSNTDTSTPGVTGMITKGTDRVDGGSFDTDLTNIIDGRYGFSRLDDVTPELPAAEQTTANGLVNPNGSCEANLSIGSSGISVGSSSITLTGTVPSTVQAGWTVAIPAGFSAALPSGTAVSGVSGSTITLSNAVVAGTGGTAPPTLYFPGRPPVLAVTDPDS